jgi:predicted chitinase
MQQFYDEIRAAFGKISKEQVAHIDALVRATDGLPIRHRAYVLATAWHETGRFRHTHEIWGPTAQQKKYEPGGAKARELGNTMKGDGFRFRGRGYCQLTGRNNYVRASSVVGVDLVGNPDLAKRPDIAARCIVAGMRDGWFTGRKMADFASFVDMRRVVNGTDRAEMIAGYATAFLRAFMTMPPPVPEAQRAAQPATPQETMAAKIAVGSFPARATGFWGWVRSLFA